MIDRTTPRVLHGWDGVSEGEVGLHLGGVWVGFG